ncbi:MAG: response regulator [Lachnospiraceae bacterium]|jgi:YesN/AraC family two-component response regulator|nr:response regulator [Lachnospiraceae bacterium]MCI1399028.1 response regulator [Lachnospiraceae bacterium]
MYRLVIVDDEKIVIRGIQVLLAKMNIDCEVVGTAWDGREALEVIRRTHPDVVITDIRIPYLDGLSLIESAQEFNRNCDYIIISAYQEFSYARKALVLGALDYIDKPVTRDKLRMAFERLQKRREGEIPPAEKDPVPQQEDTAVSDSRETAKNDKALVKKRVDKRSPSMRPLIPHFELELGTLLSVLCCIM